MSVVWIALYIIFSVIGARELYAGRSGASVVPLLTATLILTALAREGVGYAMLAAMLFTMSLLPLGVVYWHLSAVDEPVTQDP